jgi:LPS-assembly protein
MSRTFLIGAILLGLTFAPSPATGQINIPGYDIIAFYKERLKEKHWMLRGAVELERGDTKLYADEVEVFEGDDSVIARGNVVLTQGNSRIAADRAEFNLKTRLGTFHSANGIAAQQPGRQPMQSSGLVVPQAIGQDTDVYFFGETVEKISAKRYRITNGGFSTCVQPTPRWQLSADTLVLNVDDYTLLRQVTFSVKNVPMLYLPWLYYPTQEDGRATGFLLPTYSNSSIDGHSIHNAFFWAITRSMDATVFHDYLSRTGGRVGGEYRYNLGGGSDGSFVASGLDARARTFQPIGGAAVRQEASRTYKVNGNANQMFPGQLRGRAYVDYFSSVITNQIYTADINLASTNTRTYGGNVVGAWGTYSLNGTFNRQEWFSSPTNSRLTGSSPRVTFSRNERPIVPNSPLYVSLSSEAAHLDNTTNNTGTVDNRSLWRLDFQPRIRYPIKNWTWFTVNTSAAWRNTFYSRSLELLTGRPIDTGVNRQYLAVRADAVGPVFARVWDTPDSGYAERIKHTIEPTFSVDRTSAVDIQRIITNDGTDTVYGTTTMNYGLNNRIYAKRRLGQISQAQEIVSFGISQSYYVDAQASKYDAQQNTNFVGSSPVYVPSNFSPVRMTARFSPTTTISGDLTGDIDSRTTQFRSLAVGANYNVPQRLTTSLRWSRTFFVPNTPGYDNREFLTHSLNFSGNVQTRDNRYGLNYSGYYDVRRSQVLQQQISAFYNAQCCGIAVQYSRQAGSPADSTTFIPAVNRFFLSFTLAGLGNFSPVGGMNNGRR